MKRTLTAVLCAAMLASLTACGGGSDSKPAAGAADQTTAAQETVKELTPEEIYKEAMEKNASLESMDVDMVMNMNMTMGEQAMDMKMDMKMQSAGKGEDTKLLMTSTTEADGQSIEMTMFYADGYYYMDAMGQKIKYLMDASEIAAQTEAQTAGVELEVEWLTDLTVEDQGEDKLLKFVGDPDKMHDYVQDTLANSGSANGLEGMDLTVNEISGEYLIGADGYYKDAKIKMDLTLSADGQEAKMVMDIDMTYNNPGQPVEVTIPSTDGYTEVDASMMQNAA